MCKVMELKLLKKEIKIKGMKGLNKFLERQFAGYYFSFFFVFIICNVFGQTQNPYSYMQSQIASPGSSGGNGSSSVNLCTGKASTSIPIYTYQGRETSLPISLNYTANGIKVEELASSVGLGWSLNVGGRINRVVNAQPDDYNNGNAICTPYHEEWFDEDYYMMDAFGVSDCFIYQISHGVLTAQLNPLINAGYNTATKEWIVKLADGAVLYFGEFNTRETSSTLTGVVSPSCGSENTVTTSSWLLTKIISKNKLDEYRFVYQNFEWLNYIPNNGEGYEYGMNLFRLTTSSYKINQQMIKEIYHNNDKIIGFNYDTRQDMQFVGGNTIGNKLSEIEFYNYKSSSKYKKIGFTYSYFGNTAPTSTYLEKRLKLDEINLFGVNSANPTGLSNAKYSFEYFNPSQIPAITSYAQDYLGLYNGSDTNPNLVPFGGGIRTYNFNKSLTGTLVRINYPTKGYDVYEYEQNALEGQYGYTKIPEQITSTTQDVNLAVINQEICTVAQIYKSPSTAMSSVGLCNYPPYGTVGCGSTYSLKARTVLMRLSSITNCKIKTDGFGIFLIQKIDNCNNVANDVFSDCNFPFSVTGQASFPHNPCLNPVNTINYNGSPSSVTNFEIGGRTNNGSWLNPIDKTLAAGNYQVTLWQYGDPGAPSTDGMSSLHIYTAVTTTTVIPEYYVDLDTQSNLQDGFRIKAIKSYESAGVLSKNTQYKYSNGILQDVLPITYQNGSTNKKTSVGYRNAPNIISYLRGKEVVINSSGENNGYKEFTYLDNDIGGPLTGSYNRAISNNGIMHAISQTEESRGVVYFLKKPPETLIGINVFDRYSNLLSSQTNYFDSFPLPDVKPGMERVHEFYAGNDNFKYFNNNKKMQQTTTIDQSGGYTIINNTIDHHDGTIERYYYTYVTNPINQARLVEQTQKLNENNTVMTTSKNIYSTLGTRYLLTEIQYSVGTNPTVPKTRLEYDTDGNMVSTVQITPGVINNNQWDSLIYGYDNKVIVAKLSGIRYSDIPPSLITAIKTASSTAITPASQASMETALNALRTSTDVNLKNAQISTMTYNPVFGVTSSTDPKGYTVYNEYDVFGRPTITKEKDENGVFRILTENQYNTRPN